MSNPATYVSSLTGWRRAAAAFGAGLVSVLAMAPFFLFPVLFVTFPVLVWLIDGATGNRSEQQAVTAWRRLRASPAMRTAAVGWCFALGYFFGGLFWIGEAFLVEAEIFAWLLPFAVTLMPTGLALFWAAAAAIASLAWRPGSTRVLALALSLSAFEYLRGHVLTGFPWNVPGYALTYPLALMQSAGLFGIYGLSLIAILVFASPAVMWFAGTGSAIGKRTAAAIAIAILPLLAALLFGHVRLSMSEPGSVAGVKLRIVQPSVRQRDKWRPEHQLRIFEDHINMSRSSAAGVRDDLRATTLLIWPEAAMPFMPLREPKALKAIADLLPANSHLLSGALRLEDADPELPWSRRRFFNSLLVFGPGGSLGDKYDKTHLVPFGEYLPFQTTLEAIGLQQLTRLRGGFDVGPSPRPNLTIAGMPPVGALICYEAIFPGVGAMASARPGVLINVTNDGWFGNTTGPRQHLHQSRVRAVEEGLPLIRAANNGISAVIDAKGRMLHQLGMNKRGVIDADLPAALPPPPYARWGDTVFFALWLFGLAVLGLHLRRNPQNSRATPG